jgi:hypothetical protein
MSSRVDNVKLAIESINDGRTSLISKEGQLIGKSDDLGLYIFVSYYSKLIGNANADFAIKTFTLLMSALALGFMPIMFCKIFDSIPIGIVSPIVAYLTFDLFKTSTDVYWVQQWIILIGLPIVLLIYKRPWDKYGLFLAGALAMAISFSNFIRSNSGLGVFILLLVVLFNKVKKELLKKACVILLIFIFSLTFNFIFINIYSMANKIDLGNNASHPFWHSVYIGLGAVPNNYGIKYDDSVGFIKAHDIDPDVKEYSKEYDSILKNECIKLLINDRKFIYEGLKYKMDYCFKYVKNQFFTNSNLVLFIIISLVVLRKYHIRDDKWKYYRAFLLSLIPLFIFGILPGIIVTPFNTYFYGASATAYYFYMFLIFYVLESFVIWGTANKHILLNRRLSKKQSM